MLKTDSLSALVNEHRAMRTDSCTQILHENLERVGDWRKLDFVKKRQEKFSLQRLSIDSRASPHPHPHHDHHQYDQAGQW